MENRGFDNLPYLSKEEALKILATPLERLKLSSDYYKAVFHLQKYPCLETKLALLELLKLENYEQPINIAKRKAIEVLARLGYIDVIPLIGKYLDSSDPYLVENAAWALNYMGCEDEYLKTKLCNLLDDPKQNRRLLIQVLCGLGVDKALPKIKSFLNDENCPGSVSGACIAAISRLSGEKISIYKLKEILNSPNQNDRQCAVQDVIDIGDINFLPLVLKTPVAPYFRMKALTELWPKESKQIIGMSLFEILDSLINDHPNNIKIINIHKTLPDTVSLVEDLFNPDFNKCYFALNTLIQKTPKDIWKYLLANWKRLEKDYGAIYFVLQLARNSEDLDPSIINQIEDLSITSMSSKWPSYMKFRPTAVLTLMKFWPEKYFNELTIWLDERKNPFWATRYAALMSLENKNIFSNKNNILSISANDSNQFVKLKAEDIILKTSQS